MAEDSFKSLVIGFLLFTAFSIMILSAVNFQGALYDREADASSVTDTLGLSYFESNASFMSETITTQFEQYQNQNPLLTLGDIVLGGLWDIAVFMFQVIISPFFLIANILTNVFHLPTIVTTTISLIIIITIMFSVWRLLKIGD